MSKYILIFMLSILSLTDSKQVEKQPKEKPEILQTQYLEKGISFQLHRKMEDGLLMEKPVYSLVYQEYVQNEKQQEYTVQLNELIPDLKWGWETMDELQLFFVNKKLGYLYGFSKGYGYHPHFYKTTDGGRSWTIKIFDDYTLYLPFDKNSFFMFDDQKGILMMNTKHFTKDNFLLDYYLTKDGWETWKLHQIDLNDQANNEHLINQIQRYYSTDGTITFLLHDKIKTRPTQKTNLLIFQSKDFGHSFSLLK